MKLHGSSVLGIYLLKKLHVVGLIVTTILIGDTFAYYSSVDVHITSQYVNISTELLVM